MKVMGSSSSNSSLFPLNGSSSSSLPLQQGNKSIAQNGSNGICHSKRRKLQQQQAQFPQQQHTSNHRRHISFTLTVTGIVVTALFLNVVLVHVRLFSDFTTTKRISSTSNNLDPSDSLHVVVGEVENSIGDSIGETLQYNNHDDESSALNGATGATTAQTSQIFPETDAQGQTGPELNAEQELPLSQQYQSKMIRPDRKAHV